MDDDQIVIKCYAYGEKMSIKFPKDTTIWELSDKLKLIPTFLGYHINNINDIFSSDNDSSEEDLDESK